MIEFGIFLTVVFGMFLLFALALAYLTRDANVSLPDTRPTCCTFHDRNVRAMAVIDELIEKHSDEEFLDDLYNVHNALTGDDEEIDE